MSNLLIISGHGKYATSIQSSLELLAGNNEAVKYIDFTIEDSDLSLKEKIQEAIKESKADGVLVVCDILGGTPFKSAVELSFLQDNIEVVAGCNLGAILETSLQLDYMTVGEQATRIVESSIKSTIHFKPSTINSQDEQLEESLGI